MIKTGKAPISLMTYLAIMSVCFVINLPGIAIAPIEGRLKDIIHAGELEVQLLTTLPNFVIIPFILLTGKLSQCRHKLPWIIMALLLYLATAIGYLFADSITWLIIISCLLGCANGILIPFAMGFVVNTFYGKYRTRQLGMKSGISNLAVVFGSFLVGFLIETDNWHLPFIVYLAVILPLAFCYWLKYVPGLSAKEFDKEKETLSSNIEKDITHCIDDIHSSLKDINMKRVWALICNNVCFSFLAMAVIIYLPQMIQTYGWDPSISGEVAAVFFIFVLLAGFVLLPLVRFFRHYTFFGIGIFLLSGLAFITFIHREWAMFVGASLCGIAFGIFQPFVYDKTSYTVTNPKKNILALSFVLTALYAAIALEPFIITGICKLFKVEDENFFALRFSFFAAIGYAVVAFFFKEEFAFSVEPAYIEEPDSALSTK